MNRDKATDNLYRTHRKYMYYLRKNRTQLEKQNQVFVSKLKRFMAFSESASTALMESGFTLEQVYRIEQRAFFDALLQLSQEGDLPYKEYFVLMERTDTPGDYDLVSAEGDLPEKFREDITYTTYQLTQFEALVHCYYKSPIENQEAMAVVLGMAQGKVLGNIGVMLYE